MAHCDLIFVLNDGKELIGKDDIINNLALFPIDILEKTKPLFLDVLKRTNGWNYSVIKVYQNGKTEIVENIPPNLPFGIE